MRRFRLAARAQRTIVLAAVVLLLLALAKLHACACTGGQPQWRTVYPAAAE
jgi:hypothetical protein